MQDLRSRWNRLMLQFDFSANEAEFEKIRTRYSEKHRHYHTLEHIYACLSHLDEVRGQAKYPSEIEMALWFHDVVYAPYKSDNELQSAIMAAEFLQRGGASAESVARIHSLVMVTLHDAPTVLDDELLMVDIDLSILGAPEDIYDQFEENIRREYRWVPRRIYKRKRIEILQGFLGRKVIYQNTYFQERFEKQSRVNLARALRSLSR